MRGLSMLSSVPVSAPCLVFDVAVSLFVFRKNAQAFLNPGFRQYAKASRKPPSG